LCFFIAGFGSSETSVHNTEICDNALDDDGDGLIDLNDPDCVCNGIRDTFFVPSGLIPNPSFEDYFECPDTTAQLNKCKNWIQASAATSDYFNLCDFWQDVVRGTPPLPLPAGNGYVGFLDIENLGFGAYKEYVGACLSEPMVPGKEYTLSFWVGFGRRGTQQFGNGYIGPRRSFNMAVFGTSDCSNLPFGAGAPNPYLCPTAYSGWFELSRLTVTGSNKWIKTTIKIRPNVKVESIVLGPACAPTDGNYFYWLDELILEETSRIDSFYFNVVGLPCSDTLRLEGLKTNIPSIKYQWYKDGVAIPGANAKDYQIPKGQEGVYVLRASDGKECELSEAFQYKLDQDYTFVDSVICEGSAIEFGGIWIDKEGQYTLISKNKNGCDSTVYLFLEIENSQVFFLDTVICQDGTLMVGDTVITTEGPHTLSLKTGSGCDSIIHINLEKVDFFEIRLDTSICEGSMLQIADTVLTLPGTHRWLINTNSGCDSFIEVNLNIYPRSFIVDYRELCDGDTLIIDNKLFYASGLYDHQTISNNGCDSLYRLVLNVNPIYFNNLDTNICEGDFLDFGGKRFDQQGNYKLSLQSQLGCDSIFNLNLGILPVKINRLDTQICQGEQLIFGAKSFSTSGHFEWKEKGLQRCDDLYVLNLKVSDSYKLVVDTVLCEGEFLDFQGKLYNKPGQYWIDLPSSGACDSVLELNIDFLPEQNIQLDTTLCSGTKFSYGQVVLDSAGQFIFTNKNWAGCDSVVQIDLSFYPSIEIDPLKKDPVCYGQSNGEIKMLITGGAGVYSYSWSDGDTTSIRSSLGDGLYQVTVTDRAGCTASSVFEINSPECFCFDFSKEDFYCFDPEKGSAHIQRISGGKDPVSYFLNSKEINNLIPDINGLDTGSYNLVIKDSLGCEVSYEFSIQKLFSERELIRVDTFFVFIGDSVGLRFGGDNFNSNDFTINWFGTSELNCTDCAQIVVQAKDENSEYVAVGKDQNGCEYEYRVRILARTNFWVPNAFTPNSDGVNDYFNLYTDPSIEKIDLLQIYNRWGGLLFESRGGQPNSPVGAWTGESNGQSVNPGVYTYLFLFKDKADKSYRIYGDVTLIR